jgi:hypothetical protein
VNTPELHLNFGDVAFDQPPEQSHE